MGPIGMPEMIMIFLILGVIAVVIAIIIALEVSRKSMKSPAADFSRSNSAQARLSEIDALRKKNLITEAEYEAKRKAIVDSL